MTIQTESKTAAEQESCDHVKTVVVILPRNPDGQGHYTDQRCATCGVHLRFLPTLETVARRKRQGLLIEKLLSVDPALEPVLARQHIGQLRDKYYRLASKYVHLRLDFVHMKCVLADIVSELNGNTTPKRGSQLSKLRVEARHLLERIKRQERKLQEGVKQQ
jgi:hypothetical protein